MCHTQSIQLSSLTNNNGVIPIKIGTARVQVAYKRLLHVIKLENYQELINQLKDQTNQLSLLTSTKEDYMIILNDKKIITQTKLAQLEGAFESLKPRRFKRGLINGLGSLIKDLTGNLDNQDLADIQNAINTVNNNQESLNRQINSQIHINGQMIQRLNEIQNFTSTHINRLQFEVNKTISITNSMSLVILYDQHFYKISHIIDQLRQHIEDIIEIVQLSKNKVISRHLLNHDEVHYILDLLRQNNVHLEYENSIYDLVMLKGYYNNMDIIYSIEIPQFMEEQFNYYQIKIIPTLNKIIQPIHSTTIILSQNKFQFITKPCNQVKNQYFCDKIQIREVEGTCIPAIIAQQPAHCSFQKINNILDIDYISYGKLYINPVQPIEYTSDCGQNSKSIQQQTLIIFDNCTITINGNNFTTKSKITMDHYNIHMPFNDINVITIKPIMELESMHNGTIQNMKEIKLMQTTHALYSSTGHVSLCFIISVIIYLLISKIIKNRKQQETISHLSVDNAPVHFKQTAAHLRGEESCPPLKTPAPAPRIAVTGNSSSPFTLLTDITTHNNKTTKQQSTT